MRRKFQSMKPWSRDDTRHWISQLELRVEDLDYYLTRPVQWCEDNEVYDDRLVFACAMMTTIGVAWQRGEPISRREILEVLGIQDWYVAKEEEIELGAKYQNMDLEDILEEIISNHWL